MIDIIDNNNDDVKFKTQPLQISAIVKCVVYDLLKNDLIFPQNISGASYLVTGSCTAGCTAHFLAN